MPDQRKVNRPAPKRDTRKAELAELHALLHDKDTGISVRFIKQYDATIDTDPKKFDVWVGKEESWRLANGAFNLLTLDERKRCLTKFAALRFPDIRDRFFDAVHEVITERDATEKGDATGHAVDADAQ